MSIDVHVTADCTACGASVFASWNGSRGDPPLVVCPTCKDVEVGRTADGEIDPRAGKKARLVCDRCRTPSPEWDRATCPQCGAKVEVKDGWSYD